MLLAIDIGNTNIVCGLFQGQALRHEWRLSTGMQRSPDEHRALLYTLATAEGLDLPAVVDSVVIGSVVPVVTEAFTRLCAAWLHLEPLIIHVGLDLGMGVLVREPRRVGVDRLLNALAARQALGSPCISVDFGTATKFDVVSAGGDFIGGAIAPGLLTATEALVRNTAQLPRIDYVAPASAIGDDTVSAMQAGIVYGYLGLVEGLLSRIQEALSEGRQTANSAPVVATGGLADLIAPLSNAITLHDPHLTLRGLQIIHERLQQTRRQTEGALP